MRHFTVKTSKGTMNFSLDEGAAIRFKNNSIGVVDTGNTKLFNFLKSKTIDEIITLKPMITIDFTFRDDDKHGIFKDLTYMSWVDFRELGDEIKYIINLSEDVSEKPFERLATKLTGSFSDIPDPYDHGPGKTHGEFVEEVFKDMFEKIDNYINKITPEVIKIFTDITKKEMEESLQTRISNLIEELR